MKTTYNFDGKDIFLRTGERLSRVYPAPMMGVYCADMNRGPGRVGIETAVLIHDDFGSLVDGFDGAHQRAHFRKALH